MRQGNKKVYKYYTNGNSVFIEEPYGTCKFVAITFNKYGLYNNSNRPKVDIQGSPNKFKLIQENYWARFNCRQHHNLLNLLRSGDEETFLLACEMIKIRKLEEEENKKG